MTPDILFRQPLTYQYANTFKSTRIFWVFPEFIFTMYLPFFAKKQKKHQWIYRFFGSGSYDWPIGSSPLYIRYLW